LAARPRVFNAGTTSPADHGIIAHDPGSKLFTVRQLLLMRHAKSAWDDPKLADHERPLNPRGRLAATAMREAMRGLGLAPDMVLVSTSRRTLQTLEALEPWDETPLVEASDALYLATPLQVLKVLNTVPETTRSVLLVGHNPGLHELAKLLAGPAAMAVRDTMTQRLTEGYPTGALAEFAIPGPWGGLGEGGGRLIRFLAPRDLPELAREG
jgi:phosphohistidine phosphatase